MGFRDRFWANEGDIPSIFPQIFLISSLNPAISSIKTHITEMRKRFKVIISPPHLYKLRARVLTLYNTGPS